jgi:hypothetical protein
MSWGYVYVLYNPTMEGIVKIGRTRKSSEERAADISRATGVAMSFLVVYDERVCDCAAVEKRLHERFSHTRVNPKREFFRVPLKEAVKALQEVAAEFREVTPEADYMPSQAVEMLPDLKRLYPAYLKPEIKSVRLVQRSGICFLEVVSIVAEHLNDERIERVDLGFIVEGDPDTPMFSPIRNANENATKFLAELDPYSIVMCTPLFTEEACLEVARRFES